MSVQSEIYFLLDSRKWLGTVLWFTQKLPMVQCVMAVSNLSTLNLFLLSSTFFLDGNDKGTSSLHHLCFLTVPNVLWLVSTNGILLCCLFSVATVRLRTVPKVSPNRHSSIEYIFMSESILQSIVEGVQLPIWTVRRSVLGLGMCMWYINQNGRNTLAILKLVMRRGYIMRVKSGLHDVKVLLTRHDRRCENADRGGAGFCVTRRPKYPTWKH
jgi:hypothetical protein